MGLGMKRSQASNLLAAFFWRFGKGQRKMGIVPPQQAAMLVGAAHKAQTDCLGDSRSVWNNRYSVELAK